MTEPTWKNWTPQYDGHAPDDWDGGYRQYFTLTEGWKPVYTNKDKWFRLKYRYFAKPLQDATHEPDLLAQCLMLPQADRDALIEALQKPQEPETDWAEDVWDTAYKAYFTANPNCLSDEAAFEVIRSMCRPKEDLQELTEAAKSARVLIGARNDSLSEAARASNINEAWHILDKAIAKATK